MPGISFPVTNSLTPTFAFVQGCAAAQPCAPWPRISALPSGTRSKHPAVGDDDDDITPDATWKAG
jgi:hypothetical protein